MGRLAREGWPDLSGGEADFYTAIQQFNARSRNIKAIFINQFGFDPKSCGRHMPGDVESMDIRKGADVEFGQSIYEPFGIAQFEPLTFGAICVATNLANEVIVAGWFWGTVDFGGGPLTPPWFYGYGMFVAKFDSNGNHIWSKSYGWDYFNSALGGLATDAMGNVVVFGQFVNSIDFGGGVLTSAGLTDLFLLNAVGVHVSALSRAAARTISSTSRLHSLEFSSSVAMASRSTPSSSSSA